MIIEGPDGTFCGISTMLFGRHALKGDVIFKKGVFRILGALIVKDVKIG
jgi:hypothetical protein